MWGIVVRFHMQTSTLYVLLLRAWPVDNTQDSDYSYTEVRHQRQQALLSDAPVTASLADFVQDCLQMTGVNLALSVFGSGEGGGGLQFCPDSCWSCCVLSKQ